MTIMSSPFLFIYDDSDGRVSLDNLNLPYRHFRAYAIALRYHFSDIMSHSYRCELCGNESFASIAELWRYA